MALYKVTVQGGNIDHFTATEYIVAENIVHAIQEAVRLRHAHDHCTGISQVDSAELIAASVQIAVIGGENV